MPKSDLFSLNFLQLIFQGVTTANLARNTIGGVTSLTVALHTSAPGDSGDQSTNEISYTGYARVSVSRTSAGWVVSAAGASPISPIVFPAMAGGAGGTVTHFSVGTGVGNAMLYWGTVAPTILVATGVI